MTKREAHQIPELLDEERGWADTEWCRLFAERERASELADLDRQYNRQYITPLPELGVWAFLFAGCVAWGCVMWWAR